MPSSVQSRSKARDRVRCSAACLRFFGVLWGALSLAACRPEAETTPVAGEAEAAEPARVVVHNARVHTLDADATVIENGALAIGSEGELLAVGGSAALLQRFDEASAVDLHGRNVLPGLIDAHAHLTGFAVDLTRANLTGTRSKAEVIERLEDFAESLPAEEWLLGRGWDQNDWPESAFPGRADLDAVFPHRPVWLVRIDGHAGWANSAALRAADRDLSGDWNPPDGVIHRDAAGAASGILIDGAMTLVEQHVPPISDDRWQAAMDQAIDVLLESGLTGVQEAGLSLEAFERLRTRRAGGRLPLRVYAMTDGIGSLFERSCRERRFEDPDSRLLVRSVKLYADGALGSRGAALLADYSDDPGNRGLPFQDSAALESAFRSILECDLQIAIHAIGDAGNRQVLDAFAATLPDYPQNPGRHRIEHAQVITPEDIPRFAALGIIASMQPTHATSDMYWAGARLGPERVTGAYAWRSLLDAGARLALGSDFPVEAVSPMLGIYAAVTRRDLQGWPDEGWFPEQALTRAEAVRGFTVDAAHAAFMEGVVGSLEAGKQADFIVLDRDLMSIPAEQIPAVQVLETWIDGDRVYARSP